MGLKIKVMTKGWKLMGEIVVSNLVKYIGARWLEDKCWKERGIGGIEQKKEKRGKCFNLADMFIQSDL